MVKSQPENRRRMKWQSVVDFQAAACREIWRIL